MFVFPGFEHRVHCHPSHLFDNNRRQQKERATKALLKLITMASPEDYWWPASDRYVTELDTTDPLTEHIPAAGGGRDGHAGARIRGNIADPGTAGAGGTPRSRYPGRGWHSAVRRP